MPNIVITYILNIYIWCVNKFTDNILKWTWALFCTPLKGFKYYSHYLASVICLHTVYSIWLIDKFLPGANTLGQSKPGTNGNEGVLHIPQSSKAGALPSDSLMSYSEHLLEGESCPSVEMQSVYSTDPTDWARVLTTKLSKL